MMTQISDVLTATGIIGITAARILVGSTLLVSGIAKLHKGQAGFLKAILGYDLAPKEIAIILARWLPWLELLTGILLVVGYMTREAAVAAFGLFLVFTIAIALSLLRGRDNDCGCLGKLTPVQWRLAYRNVFLMGLLLPVYALGGGRLAIDAWSRVSPLQSGSVSTDIMILLITVWGLLLVMALSLQRLLRMRIVQVQNRPQP